MQIRNLSIIIRHNIKFEAVFVLTIVELAMLCAAVPANWLFLSGIL